MTTLYVFIDESGNENRGDYYSVAGCWCVSSERNFTAVLDPTVQRLMDVAESTLHDSSPIAELKGASLPTDVITAVFESFETISYDDSTVPHTAVPWEPAYPVRFSTATINPTIGRTAIADIVGTEVDAPKALKLLLLISVLDPLFRSELLDPSLFDDVRIILDATVWQNPAQHARDAFDEVGYSTADISFDIENSKRTPGLQLADLAAYSWTRHLRKGDCNTIVEQIDRYRFADV